MQLIPQAHPFWRTSRELRGVLRELEAGLGHAPEAAALLRELEAMQGCLETEVRDRHRRAGRRTVPVQKVAGFP